MKRVIISFVFACIGFLTFAQSGSVAPVIKYVTTAPDGSIAMTIYDSDDRDTMQLESAENFYRYEILDLATSEPVYEASNKGKTCTIAKNKIESGTYNLRLYTTSFVITSKITIMASRKMHTDNERNYTVAARE